MNAYKSVRKELIVKYADAIMEMFKAYGDDSFVCFEKLLANGRAVLREELEPYPIPIEFDYAAFMEDAKALYPVE